MAENIIKYSNNFNVDSVQSQITLDGSQNNYNYESSPLSFKEWLSRRTGIEPNREYFEYNRYVRSWYSEQYQLKEIRSKALKNDYVSLLQQLSLIFKDDDLKFVTDVNYDDNLDIEYAIPYYTKKLKEIAYYIVKKRESAKNAKLKYNLAGSNQGLEKLFYQYLLQAFTRKNSLIEIPDFSAVSVLPELSATVFDFSISVEELYDKNSYLDKDYNTFSSILSGFCIKQQNLINEKTLEYFDTLNYDSSSVNWIFESGFIPLCADNPLLWTLQGLLDSYGVQNTSQLPYSALELSDIDNPNPNDYNLFYLNKKYLGNNMYILTGGYYILDTENTNLNLTIGNNWFYWPSGEFFTDNFNVIKFEPIPLSSTKLIENGATASEDYRNADRIFVERDGQVKGAWLRNNIINDQLSTMKCAIVGNGSITFRFPYSDFGYAGERVVWSGRSIDNSNSLYYYLDDELKKKTDSFYWETTESTSICAIEINDTTLADISNINSSQYYDSADKIIKRIGKDSTKIYDNNFDEVYNDGFEYAWLYRPIKTDLPIKVGQSNYLWPLQRLDDPKASTIKIKSDFTNPVSLSLVDVNEFIGARAGYGLSDSDIIYKLNAKNGYPIEAAFLKGKLIRESLNQSIKVIDSDYTTYISTVTGVMQIGLNHKCKPNTPETFIWQDPDTTISSLDLTYKKHQDDCPFKLYSKHSSIYDQKDNAEFTFNYPWSECNCKSVLYSPIGHTGNNFEDYNGMADIIVLDTQYPNDFNLGTWTGSDGLPFYESSDFAWYKISKPENVQNNDYGLDVDVGMGVGSWVTGSGQPFTFKTGKQYKYIRNGLGRNKTEIDAALVPYFIISKLYTHDYKPEWTKAVYDSTLQTWVETNNTTDMVLNAGEYIVYDHFESNFYCLRFDGSYKQYTVTTYPSVRQNNSNNPWVNFDYVTTGVAVIVTWPDELINSQFTPSVLASELSAIEWTVTSNSDLIPSYTVRYPASESLTIVSNTPATFTVNAIGYPDSNITNASPVAVGSGKLPSISVIAPPETNTVQSSGAYDIRTIYADSINFIWNTPLVNSKPFWGSGLDDNSYTTKFKGVREWGYGLRVADDYTFIHQPPASRMTLNAEDPITYINKGSTITWEQPVIFNVNIQEKSWCKLNYVTDKVIPISSQLNNINTELVVYPTYEISDIVLNVNDFINYYSINPFTWTEVLTNTLNGVPPFGGKYVPFTSALAIESLVPYANLMNRHYPTIAVYPNANGFYTERESGGYFIPYMLGTNTYLGKNYTNVINPELSAGSLVGKELLFRDPNVFASNDVGLTNERQVGPIKTIDYNASWAKASLTEGKKTGEIINAADFKEFIPYQTREETLKLDINNIFSKNTDLDPWHGEFDDVWKNKDTWPSNFRGENRIVDWYNNNNFFIKSVESKTFNQTLCFEQPLICEGESRFLIKRNFTNTECRDCNSLIYSFTAPVVTDTVTSDGSLILDLNREKYYRYHIPVFTSGTINSKTFDPDKVLYAEQVYGQSSRFTGYLPIKVNGSTYYIRVNVGRITRNCVSSLSGTMYYGDDLAIDKYLPVRINDFKNVYLELYSRSALPKVATPVISPSTGTFAFSFQCTITCSTANSIIRYTSDGSEPNVNSPVYSGPFTISSSVTIKAKGFRTGYINSDTASRTYLKVEAPRVATPVITPESGVYDQNVGITVQITCSTIGATIRYTVDGTEPTSSSPIYSSSFNLNVGTTVKAKAFKVDYIDSDTASNSYSFDCLEQTYIVTDIGLPSQAVALETKCAENDFKKIIFQDECNNVFIKANQSNRTFVPLNIILQVPEGNKSFVCTDEALKVYAVTVQETSRLYILPPTKLEYALYTVKDPIYRSAGIVLQDGTICYINGGIYCSDIDNANTVKHIIIQHGSKLYVNGNIICNTPLNRTNDILVQDSIMYVNGNISGKISLDSNSKIYLTGTVQGGTTNPNIIQNWTGWQDSMIPSIYDIWPNYPNSRGQEYNFCTLRDDQDVT